MVDGNCSCSFGILYLFSMTKTNVDVCVFLFRGAIDCWSAHSWVDQFQEREFSFRSAVNESSCCCSRCYRRPNGEQCLLLWGEVLVVCDLGFNHGNILICFFCDFLFCNMIVVCRRVRVFLVPVNGLCYHPNSIVMLRPFFFPFCHILREKD